MLAKRLVLSDTVIRRQSPWQRAAFDFALLDGLSLPACCKCRLLRRQTGFCRRSSPHAPPKLKRFRSDQLRISYGQDCSKMRTQSAAHQLQSRCFGKTHKQSVTHQLQSRLFEKYTHKQSFTHQLQSRLPGKHAQAISYASVTVEILWRNTLRKSVTHQLRSRLFGKTPTGNQLRIGYGRDSLENTLKQSVTHQLRSRFFGKTPTGNQLRISGCFSKESRP